MFIIIMCIHCDEQIVYDDMMKFEDKYFCNGILELADGCGFYPGNHTSGNYPKMNDD